MRTYLIPGRDVDERGEYLFQLIEKMKKKGWKEGKVERAFSIFLYKEDRFFCEIDYKKGDYCFYTLKGLFKNVYSN